MTMMTTIQASDAIGVPHSTLQGWLRNIPVPLSRDKNGERGIDTAGLALLERIKVLWLEEGLPFEAIREALQAELQATVAPEEPLVPAPIIAGEIVDPATIGCFTEFARELARAAHRIGRLEAENGFLRTQLGEARQRLTDGRPGLEERLQAAGEQHRAARQLLAEYIRDHDELSRELGRIQRERDDLRAAFNRPWWQRLLLPAR